MIDILIPALGRPQQIDAVYKSIEATTQTEHQIIFITSPGDIEVVNAVKALGLKPLRVRWKPGRADYAKKINYAYSKSEAEWIFQAATDLVFYRGWDTAALVQTRRGHGVVGTNDMGNPDVKKGRHSTHSLISRRYIEEYGGTADNSGVVFSEAYDHQYCDNEFVETAQRRGQFVFARRSVVEHLHPHWGKADDDETYVKAMRETLQDRALFVKRRSQMARWESKRKWQKS